MGKSSQKSKKRRRSSSSARFEAIEEKLARLIDCFNQKEVTASRGALSSSFASFFLVPRIDQEEQIEPLLDDIKDVCDRTSPAPREEFFESLVEREGLRDTFSAVVSTCPDKDNVPHTIPPA